VDKTTMFLEAMAKGKHRKGSNKRLRKIVAEQEIERYGKLTCFCCGGELSISSSTLEHIIPQSKGGLTTLNNLALSHAKCNVERADSGKERNK
jgi:5-methylcytosine-specific restriction endonuclease McrA